MSTATILTKRRPGRPRKNPEATVTSPENGTFVDVVTNPEPTAPVVKRRGRPKGSKNKPKVTPTAATAPVVKRRGRPKGSKNKPKVTAPAPVTVTAPVVKHRGRPKGSKNKPKVTAPVTVTATAPVVKRGPGRPRKNPEAVVTAPVVVKRRPGRPKGSKNKPKVTATVTAPATAPVVKRGPGRPRKNPVAVTTVTESTVKSGGVVRNVLDNPFKVGDSVLIPSGSIFTSSAPTAKGRQVVRRGHNVTVHEIIPARVQPRKSEKGSNVLVRPARIRAKGSGGYWKDITLTDKIVRVNGKNPRYEAIAFNLQPEAATA